MTIFIRKADLNNKTQLCL